VLEINSAQEKSRMRSNFGQKRATMFTASEAIDRTRPFAVALVAREQRKTASRMLAYDRVAAKAGVSSAWLRRLVGRRHVSVALQDFLNIYSAYCRACERIEAEAEHERQMLLALKDKTHAVFEGVVPPLVLPKSESEEIEGAPKPAISPPLAQGQGR